MLYGFFKYKKEKAKPRKPDFLKLEYRKFNEDQNLL